MDLNQVLINIGLNSKEAKIYLASLELGESPASDIALRAKLNRVTTYDILKKLAQRGFVSKHTKKGKAHFSATDPDVIRDDIRKNYIDLKDALPQFRRLYGNSPHPRIRYYEGLEAVKKVYTDTLTSKTEILNYADSKSIRKFWPNYDKEYVQERVNKKIFLKGIAPYDEQGVKVRRENKEMHREIRLVNLKEFSFSNEINIYDNKVGIISFGKREITGIVIENKEIAETQRAIFMMAWDYAKVRRT